MATNITPFSAMALALRLLRMPTLTVYNPGLASINVQVDTGVAASILIWDNTTNNWAIDENTQKPVDGSNHTTPTVISVTAGHNYTVWVQKSGYSFQVKNYPKDWSVTPQGDKAYGDAAEGVTYSIHFTSK